MQAEPVAVVEGLDQLLRLPLCCCLLSRVCGGCNAPMNSNQVTRISFRENGPTKHFNYGNNAVLYPRSKRKTTMKGKQWISDTFQVAPTLVFCKIFQFDSRWDVTVDPYDCL
mmetsp:Transcript_17547/g.43168  ORF Transcript_17547/g.43168 Transcript_17547/m.43168 type:complete len:112 (+) Transcript_17547:3288-3623(+)